MTILEALKFVQRGVARRDLIPGLTNFRIKDGRVTGFNGTLALSAPVDIAFDAAPSAGHFIRALDACDDVITMVQESEHKLIVRSGRFKTAVPCVDLSTVPETIPEGVSVAPHLSMLKAFEVLTPFIGIDASRKWACGVLLAGNSAYATNNVILTEYWLGTPFPYIVNIPSSAVEEVIRIHEELLSVQLCQSSITFHYADGRWIKSQLISAYEWPDVNGVISRAWVLPETNIPRPLMPIPMGLSAACEKLARFGTKDEFYTYFRGTNASTLLNGVEDGGAMVELEGLPETGAFHTMYLSKVLDVATHADFTAYPLPVPFVGPNIRGVVLGIRQ